jgi:hypothetical protein
LDAAPFNPPVDSTDCLSFPPISSTAPSGAAAVVQDGPTVASGLAPGTADPPRRAPLAASGWGPPSTRPVNFGLFPSLSDVMSPAQHAAAAAAASHIQPAPPRRLTSGARTIPAPTNPARVQARQEDDVASASTASGGRPQSWESSPAIGVWAASPPRGVGPANSIDNTDTSRCPPTATPSTTSASLPLPTTRRSRGRSTITLMSTAGPQHNRR